MSITLDLPEELTDGISRRAESEGQTVEAYAAEAMRRQISAEELKERHQLADIDWALTHRRGSH